VSKAERDDSFDEDFEELAQKPPPLTPQQRKAFIVVIRDIWFGGTIADDERPRILLLVKRFSQKNPDPNEIKRRFSVYREKYPDWADTPESLCKHWGRCGSNPTAKKTVEQVQQEQYERQWRIGDRHTA